MATLPLTLTYEQAKADLLELVANEPDRSIDDMGGACVYFATEIVGAGPGSDLLVGQGCCIVGRVLEKHGVTYEDLGSLNEGATVGDLRNEGVVDLDARAYILLLRAQMRQDGGDAWRKAVDCSIEETEHG